MNVTFAISEPEIRRILPVLQQLRPDFEVETLLKQIQVQQQAGYQLAYVESDSGDVLCVSGFTISMNLAWGKHMYIADFVSDEQHRSTGAGSRLINWLKEYAKEMGCKQMHLDSGVNRFLAHKFYLREGFHIASHHFALKDV